MDSFLSPGLCCCMYLHEVWCKDKVLWSIRLGFLTWDSLDVWPGDHHLISSYLGLLICKVGEILGRILVRTGNTVCVTPSTQPCPQNSGEHHYCCPGKEPVCSGWICFWAASRESAGTAACGLGQDSTTVDHHWEVGRRVGTGRNRQFFWSLRRYGGFQVILPTHSHQHSSIRCSVVQHHYKDTWEHEHSKENEHLWFYPLEVRFLLKGYEAT